MNRRRSLNNDRRFSVPRAHGDEPPIGAALTVFGIVFPVPTGMNREA